jgi:hypothetical protein
VLHKTSKSTSIWGASALHGEDDEQCHIIIIITIIRDVCTGCRAGRQAVWQAQYFP